MTLQLGFDGLMAYTEWEREKWQALFRRHGAAALRVSTGPNGDGRLATVGDLVRHVFSAEKRYVERLLGASLTDTSTIPNDDADALFRFGRESRDALRQFVERLPTDRWDVPVEMPLMGHVLTATPRKIVLHVLLHETRHWAQVMTLLRVQGVKDDFHDILFSPVLGGDMRREPAKA